MTDLVVLFGNDNPQQLRADGTPEAHPFLQQSVTRIELWPGIEDEEFVQRTLSTPTSFLASAGGVSDNGRLLRMIHGSLADADKKYAVAIHEVELHVEHHSPGKAPAWISSNDPDLARVLGAYFSCPVGEPTNLLTNGGRDGIHAQAFGTSAQPAAFNYIGLTANTTAEAATDTTLTAEITTAGGGLIRAQATYSHTAGTNSTLLSKTFTANGTDTLPVAVGKIGVFNAATAGTMGMEKLLGSTATLSVSGDNVTIQYTPTLG